MAHYGLYYSEKRENPIALSQSVGISCEHTVKQLLSFTQKLVSLSFNYSCLQLSFCSVNARNNELSRCIKLQRGKVKIWATSIVVKLHGIWHAAFRSLELICMNVGIITPCMIEASP